MTTKTERLRALCDGATPGPWRVDIRGERGTFHIPKIKEHEILHIDDGVDGHTVSSANAGYIAALNPAEVRAILDLMGKMREALNRAVGTCFDERSHHQALSDPTHFVNVAMADYDLWNKGE